MTAEHRTPEEIERDIERERAGLTDAIDTLQDKFSVDHLVSQISDQFRQNGGEISRNVARSVKENPMALAVAGVGLAWLIFGKGPSASSLAQTGRKPWLGHDPSLDQHNLERDPGYNRSADYGSTGSRSGYSGGTSANSGSSGYASVPRYRSQPSWSKPAAGAGGGSHTSVGDRMGDAGSRISDAAGSARDGVANAASTVGDKASDAASSVASGVSSAASTASSAVSGAAHSVADTARAGRDSVAAGLSSARHRIAEGTETLSQAARERVIAAREAAVVARERADHYWHQSTAKATDLFEDQPLVAGLLAMAVGAAIAGALPRTRMEDEHLGKYSDDLMDEAERIFWEETEKAKHVAQAAVDEGKKIVNETKEDLDRGAPGGKSAAEAIGDKVKSDAQRVADAAKKESDKQHAGKPKA